MIKTAAKRLIENYIFQRMSESRIVGLSIGIVKDNDIIYSRGFGFRDFERGTSPTPSTIYCIGSVTKPFTALAVMQLQERGLLSLDDPVSEYIPFDVKPMGEEVLIKHLLSHTSGLSSLGYAEATLGAVTSTYDNWFPICSPKDLLVFMNGSEDWVISRPGEKYGYLNEGYILLGAIIEKATGQEYMYFVKENILEPLGMNRSTFLEDEVLNLGDIAIPYVSSDDGTKIPTRYPYGQMIADGGLMSTANDMAKFVRMIMSGGKSEGKMVISDQSIKEMRSPKIQTDDIPFASGENVHYGYGFRIRSGFLGHQLVYHSGSVFGSSAHIGLIPEEQLGLVILCNGGYFLKDIGDHALAVLLNRDPDEITYFKRMRSLDELTGNYSTFRGISNYTVSRTGGTLQLTSSFGRRTYSQTLYPVEKEGEMKSFEIVGLESTSRVLFFNQGNEKFMTYDGILAKKISPI
jgi:CubicO group peptidase (beta-lactamase class C family)